jgi:predicted DCC family thiol-disulfide oxidoreductase YuxK
MQHFTPSSDPPVLLYDGDCGFCQACVDWAKRRTRGPWVAFPLESPEGRALFPAGIIPNEIDSVVVIMSDSVKTKSDAVVAVLSRCRFPWRLAKYGAFVPRGWRDAVYDLVARHRHRPFNKGCRID